MPVVERLTERLRPGPAGLQPQTVPHWPDERAIQLAAKEVPEHTKATTRAITRHVCSARTDPMVIVLAGPPKSQLCKSKSAQTLSAVEKGTGVSCFHRRDGGATLGNPPLPRAVIVGPLSSTCSS